MIARSLSRLRSGHLLRIVEQRIVKIRRKDHRRRKHRPGQTPPPGLVAPRLPELVLILVFQHRSKVRKYSGFFANFAARKIPVMKFDIARQPLVPAFLTLAALAYAAMRGAAEYGLDPALLNGAAAIHPQPRCPRSCAAQFQVSHPVWARWIAGLLILFTGMCAGRMTIATTSIRSAPASPSRSTAPSSRARRRGATTCRHSPPRPCWRSRSRISPVHSATDTVSTPSSGRRSTSDCCHSSAPPHCRCC